MTDAWTLVLDGWDPADEGRREALCTVGNGRFATRGAAPESAADGVHYELELELRAGEPVAVEKVVALVTSRDVAVSEPSVAAVEQLAEAPDFDNLLETHELAWRQLWRRFHVNLAGGNGSATVETLRALRLSVFHVLQTVSPHNLNLDAGIPARARPGRPGSSVLHDCERARCHVQQ